MNIATTISQIRKDKKMTQEEFSKLFNVTRQTVSNWGKWKKLSWFTNIDKDKWYVWNIIRGMLSKRDKITYDELKDQIVLMTKKSLELFDKIYGQYE